ncbi:MAG: tetratricopeptide repeat protein [Candidatus Brocadiales bacterium]
MTVTLTEPSINDILEAEDITRDSVLELRKNIYSSDKAREALEEKVEMLYSSIKKEHDSVKTKDASMRLGICLWILGRIDEAIDVLAAVETRKIGLYYLGKCYHEKGNYKKAIECLEKAQRSDTEDVDIQLDIAEAMRESGDVQKALKTIQHLSKAHDNNTELHYQRAHCLDDIGEYQDAITHYERTLQLDPQHKKTLFRLAYNCDLDGEDEKAIEYYEKCVQSMPTYTNALINLGALHEDRGDYEKAAHCFETILSADPNHERAMLFMKDVKDSLTMHYDEALLKVQDKESMVSNIPISDFELSVRSKNCLEKMSIRTLGDLTKVTEAELLSFKNFGETSLTEIKEILTQKGLGLGQALEKEQEETLPTLDETKEEEKEEKDLLNQPVSELKLSTPCLKALEEIGIETIGALVEKTEAELISHKSFKKTYLKQIDEELSNCELALNTVEE